MDVWRVHQQHRVSYNAVSTATAILRSARPQTLFVLPSGYVFQLRVSLRSHEPLRILLRHSPNTLALVLWSLDSTGAAANVEFVSDGVFSSSNEFSDWTAAPTFMSQEGLRGTYTYAAPM